jgi:hypothetical protein
VWWAWELCGGAVPVLAWLGWRYLPPEDLQQQVSSWASSVQCWGSGSGSTYNRSNPDLTARSGILTIRSGSGSGSRSNLVNLYLINKIHFQSSWNNLLINFMLWSSTLGKKNCNKKVYTEVEQIFCDILQYSCNSRLTHLRRSGPDTDPVSNRPDPPTLLPATFHMFNFYCDPLNFTNVEVKYFDLLWYPWRHAGKLAYNNRIMDV